jgi:hypothetical protein
VKIILHLIKCLPPTENDEQKSNVENQHEAEHQWPAGSFQNKKFPNSNYTETLKLILSWHLMKDTFNVFC